MYASGTSQDRKAESRERKKTKKELEESASSESEWESESETDTEGYVPDELEEGSDSEETRSEELVQRNTRPKPNPSQEEKRSKKKHESNNATEGFSGLKQSENRTLAKTIKCIRKRKNEEKEEKNNKKKKQPDGKSPTKSTNVELEHEPPQQPRQLEEETPIRQPQQQPPKPHQDDIIEISSCLDDEQPPDHMEVLHPLVPKVEELQEDQPPRVVEQPSQTVVEVVPIYPTQEIIDVSSGSEDERQPLIPKTEEYHVSSPSARIITEVLMTMNREPQRDEAPSFDLGINSPLFTTQDLSDIEELDELVKKAQDQFQTPQTKKSLENQKDLEEKVVTWATVPKGDNEFETIFKLSANRFLEAMRYQFQSMGPRTYIDIQVITIMCHIVNNEQNERFEKFVYCVPPEIMVRMFEKHGQSWMDIEKNRPHDIASLVNHQEYMVYLDKNKLLTHRFKMDFFVLDSKNIVSPSDERSTMNRPTSWVKCESGQEPIHLQRRVMLFVAKIRQHPWAAK
ncbi:hypothetical protein PIB30_100688 [Stylosanthes scabra]|uniref:Uncharacterized protein n=1 Tax=Stylosanthes scabra TaxID=79078 RepID=A0ABU6WZV5_9FABA|nr:hypothetical protein [Stylosanthes scabra]